MKIPSHIKSILIFLIFNSTLAGLSTYFKHYIGNKENLRNFAIYFYTGFPFSFLILLFSYIVYRNWFSKEDNIR